MQKLKMKSYVAVEKPFVSKKNIAARIQWALNHKDWTQDQWSNVMFTDESSFCVRPNKNKVRVRRLPGQEYSAKWPFKWCQFKSFTSLNCFPVFRPIVLGLSWYKIELPL